MRTGSVEDVVLMVSVLVLLSLAPMAEAQVAAPDYVFLDTAQTSTLQRELQEAADNEYRAVSTSLRQPVSAFTVSTPRLRRGATTTGRVAVAAG